MSTYPGSTRWGTPLACVAPPGGRKTFRAPRATRLARTAGVRRRGLAARALGPTRRNPTRHSRRIELSHPCGVAAGLEDPRCEGAARSACELRRVSRTAAKDTVERIPPMITCEKCGANAPADAPKRAERLNWHATENDGLLCPRCWNAERDADRTVQAARRLGSEPAEDRPPARGDVEAARNGLRRA